MFKLENLLIEANEYHTQYIQKCKVFKILFSGYNKCKYSFGLDELDAVINSKMSVRKAKKIISIQEINFVELDIFNLPLFVCDLLGKDGNRLKNSPWLYLVDSKNHLYIDLFYAAKLHIIPIERQLNDISFSFDDYDVKFNVTVFNTHAVIYITEKIRHIK